MSTQHHFQRILQEYAKFKASLLQHIGSEAVNFAKSNFRAQGFQDTPGAPTPWRPRSRRAPRNRGRAILTDTGALRRSIRITRIDSGSGRIFIGSSLPYAQVHNEGGRIQGTFSVRAHQRRGRPVRSHQRTVSFYMPRRRFIGPSTELNRRIKRHINLSILKIFKHS